MRKGLSADCKLDPMVVMTLMLGGQEHPCDRCNWDRKECRGYPRLDDLTSDDDDDDDDIFDDRGDNCWVHDPDMGSR